MYRLRQTDIDLFEAAKSGDYSNLYKRFPKENHKQIKQSGDQLLQYMQGDFSGVDPKDLPAAKKNVNDITAAFNKAYSRRFNTGGAVEELPGYRDRIAPGFLNVTESALQEPQAPQVATQTVQQGEEVDPTAGQDRNPYTDINPGQVENVATSQEATPQEASTYTATQALPEAERISTENQPAQQGDLDQRSLATAQETQESKVSDLEASTGQANTIEDLDSKQRRQVQQGEMVDAPATDQRVSQAIDKVEQVEAAQADPTSEATVQGQLASLMQDFEKGNTPVWAQGAMRQANQMLIARGLTASSIAGQAIIQATMESALPIAQADAQIQAQFEMKNLSNRQERAMLSAQQRAEFLGIQFDQEFQSRVLNAAAVGDAADMNFSAEQQIRLENSKAVNTMNLANLSAENGLTLAEAAALANLDMANLNNRQQSAVQNAQSFLQRDFKNLDNRQQTQLFNAQQLYQALFSDQAADNAAQQFNATSQNQVDQFFANLNQSNRQFNATALNATEQLNVNSRNAIMQFNQQSRQQRNQFNAQNSLLVAQANAQWRQAINTTNTTAQNEANMQLAKTLNNLTSNTLDAVWQRERDLMDFNYRTTENAKDRGLQLLLGDQNLEALRERIQYSEDKARSDLFFSFLFEPFSGFFGGG